MRKTGLNASGISSKKKYSSGSTFLDLDEIGKSTRDLLKDFQQCGCELKSDQMIVLDD